ncbi:MAG TPA: UTP--glucose-1-phosphate uridylyltransferase [Phycisphaerae bacterium]|nr:UTP--glucose-1-phosphate uridylyltransferase [Phycisphaerae bacterium]HOM49679.1 UTP--glucose-1-phosphate uridylyltransferase [Phycisphaerae bacterium]HOQ87137.1 UTP--glucose-1-phosphate uridylyltransferase [Phycisphaerae bacterium]HPP25048.1 UTP--glucose-1-phosphate uridylyltransferase [Phycisphaerae bacterium]HQE26482.1 UTP--glucose-1-phosphate uridylyltransferase [Phycisphaerae bacterium]
MSILVDTITSSDPQIRNRPLAGLLARLSVTEILGECEELERFRRGCENLYERVRACLFLAAAYRFHIQEAQGINPLGTVPFEGYVDLLERRFEQAIKRFRAAMHETGPNGAVISALARAYNQLGFQTLTDQVRRSVRGSRGNQWMFRVGHQADHPLRIRRELLQRSGLTYPILCERTPVRMDLSHSGWSDIFFLGMDYPEGARVVNVSVDLGVYRRDADVRPPVETYVRVLEEPLLRLTSIDLEDTRDITQLDDLFNFGSDYLSLLKAGIIASGLIPPSFEGSGQSLAEILARTVGPGLGLELVTKVNDIPKGSRLAVSTNLLASIVAVLMRATGQTRNLEGGLEESERRLVASRAILGEWLGGSGGGWQDSGGTWPGIKIIRGAEARPGDPEYGVSRGRLLPEHEVLGPDRVSPQVRELFASSVVLVHGGMAQDVGPILEMVTEKYLLRSGPEWQARQEMRGIFDAIIDGLQAGDLKAVGANTTRNWDGPLKTIIPWVTNRFTETIIRDARARLKEDFWGFLMLGGMSGGGMAFFVNPRRQAAFRDEILEIMNRAKSELCDAIPFAMDPVVYNFRINDYGTVATLRQGHQAIMPPRYYAVQVPALTRLERDKVSMLRRADLDNFTSRGGTPDELIRVLRVMVNHLFPSPGNAPAEGRAEWAAELDRIKRENGFDAVQHERIREDLRRGRIGLARNRLPASTEIVDVQSGDFIDAQSGAPDKAVQVGKDAIRRGEVAVVSLAAGVGSRWTHGAGVVKAVNPFVMIDGAHRSFMELHLAKSRRTSRTYDTTIPHVFTTSFLTHGPIEKHLALANNHGYPGPVYLSPGRSIGLRMVPMVRDLRFLWEELPQETLDEQKQKVRDDVRQALINWAQSRGEASDYVDNVPGQCFHPPGHWYELPNMLRNGVLARMLADQPSLKYLMVHNIDTLGADVDPGVLGLHILGENAVTFEVIGRRIDDRGGGLARVNGKVRLLEGLAQPSEADEFRLSFYNSNTAWVDIDRFLALFGINRAMLSGPQELLAERVREVSSRVPTYVTIKDVKRRWGHGQEDVFPVCQTEKLWTDITALPDVRCAFVAVSRRRGQQLKDVAQLDPWVNDGSLAYVRSLCDFG